MFLPLTSVADPACQLPRTFLTLTLTLTPTPTLTAAHLSAPPSAADTFRLEGDNTLIMSNVTTLEDGRSATYSQVYYRKGTKPTKPE